LHGVLFIAVGSRSFGEAECSRPVKSSSARSSFWSGGRRASRSELKARLTALGSGLGGLLRQLRLAAVAYGVLLISLVLTGLAWYYVRHTVEVENRVASTRRSRPRRPPSTGARRPT
jgi:hypothetical protein